MQFAHFSLLLFLFSALAATANSDCPESFADLDKPQVIRELEASTLSYDTIRAENLANDQANDLLITTLFLAKNQIKTQAELLSLLGKEVDWPVLKQRDPENFSRLLVFDQYKRAILSTEKLLDILESIELSGAIQLDASQVFLIAVDHPSFTLVYPYPGKPIIDHLDHWLKPQDTETIKRVCLKLAPFNFDEILFYLSRNQTLLTDQSFVKHFLSLYKATIKERAPKSSGYVPLGDSLKLLSHFPIKNLVEELDLPESFFRLVTNDPLDTNFFKVITKTDLRTDNCPQCEGYHRGGFVEQSTIAKTRRQHTDGEQYQLGRVVLVYFKNKLIGSMKMAGAHTILGLRNIQDSQGRIVMALGGVYSTSKPLYKKLIAVYQKDPKHLWVRFDLDKEVSSADLMPIRFAYTSTPDGRGFDKLSQYLSEESVNFNRLADGISIFMEDFVKRRNEIEAGIFPSVVDSASTTSP